MRVKRRLFAGGVLLVLLAWGTVQYTGMGDSTLLWPVRNVYVAAPFQKLSQTEIADAIRPLLHTDFLRLSLTDVAQAVMRLEWVKDVSVTRQWPDSLRVVVREHQVVAHWGKQDLLLEDGTVFRPRRLGALQDLPVLEGPRDRALWIWQQYAKMVAEFAALELSVDKLSYSETAGWVLQLDGQYGRKTLYFGKNRLFSRLVRFKTWYCRTESDVLSRVAYLDLRYRNGFAVGWNPANTEPNAGLSTRTVKK